MRTAMLPLLGILLVGCQPAAPNRTPTPPNNSTEAAPPVKISPAEILRQKIKGRNAEVYVQLQSIGPEDRLISASSPLAQKVVFHHTNHDGTMHDLNFIYVHPQQPAELTGEFHLMLIGLNKPLQPGDQVPLVLQFAQAGQVTTTATIR